MEKENTFLAKLRDVLLLSPPEQFDLTLEDLKQVIIGNPSITEEWVENVRKEVRCNTSNNKLFTITITRENHKIRKCLSGSSTAILKVLRTSNNEGTSSCTTSTYCTLSGTMEVQAHAFENDNNVHMSCSIDWMNPQLMTISADDDSSLCTAIANRVESWDKEILQSLNDDLYSNMEDSILKPVRRVLPISRKRMEWSLQPHRVVSNLNHLNI